MAASVGDGVFHVSLPSRERGLKQRILRLAVGELASLPSRERGLKQARGPGPGPAQGRRSLHGSVD